MADEEKELTGEDELDFDEDDLISLDDDQEGDQAAEAGPDGEESAEEAGRKVELDTSGLDLDILDEDLDEPEEEPSEPDIAIEELAEEKPAGRPKWFLPVIIGGGAVVAGVVAAALFMFRSEPPPPPPPVKTAAEQPVRPEQTVPGIPVLALKSFTIPLNQTQYNLLRVAIQIEFSSDTGKMYLERQTVSVRDVVYKTLLDQRREEMQGPKVRDEMRRAIKSALVRRFEGGLIKEVYFTEFVVL